MKTWQEIKNSLQVLPTMTALWRILKKEESKADKELIAHVLTGDPTSPYLLESNFDNKTVTFGIDWNEKTQKYYRVVSFKLPDLFLGIK